MDPSCKQCSFAMKRRHIGLQQLQAITSTAHAFLGPNKRLKFIQDEDAGDAVLIGSCPRLLEHLELDGSVGQLLHETVLAQKKLFHSGTNTLMFLAGAWSRVALECLNRGISVSDIKSAMRGGLQECLDACTQLAVSVEEFKKSDVRSNDQCIDMMVKHSRYINARTKNTQSDDNVQDFRKLSIKSDDQCMDMTHKHSRYANTQTEHAQSDDNVQDFKGSGIKSNDQCMDMTLKHSRYINTKTEHAQSNVNMQDFRKLDDKSDDQCKHMTLKHSRHFNARTKNTQSDVNVQDLKGSDIKSIDQCMDMTLKHSTHFNAQTEHNMQDFRKLDDKSDDQCMYMTLKHSRHFNAQTEHTQSEVTMQDFTKSDIKLDNQSMHMTLKHSRHFNAQTEHTHHDVTVIAQAVSHGCSSMHLLLKAYELQNRAHLDIHNLATCCIPGVSEDHACVLRGYVTLLSVQQTTQVQRLQGRPLNIALINGDLSEKYRHVGFNRPGNIKHITDLFITEESWIENAYKLLHDSSIDVVFVSGVVDVDLKQRCKDVLILEGVKSSVLKHFSTCTGAVPVSYICQLDERRVGRGLRLRKESISGRSDIVSITTDCSVLVTAVICSSVSAKLQMLEDEFWSCAHRLQHALTDGKLLHGAGVTELICIRRLRQYTQLHPDSPHDSAVLELMSEAWMDFISTVMLNSGSVANRTEAWTSITHQMRRHTDIGVTDGLGVYDNVTVKCEAWRRALDLVFLVLQSDTEIITGVSQGENTYNQLMFL
ncbi:chaperonin-containing T-complex member BBS12 isoform X1 [Danio rerio]|uniref:Chaperonin-containing T-complex member BBS12 isoform X1 n=2 Tax=Danio rerio TaxID=7955 RepID=A0A8M9QKQ4_DANRE|nr:Bardet-Biedl syndrome 12 protein isoform X2 [Danio rerio]|eukprot:XP_021336756.1 Bardet-Biedl syndrome 12 protein isoform X2 [Danio rerio]